jgi:transcriptional regulator with XRE-family HTH domain
MRELRKKRKWPQEVVAHAMGLSQPAYSRLENGEVELTLAKLESICVLYSIELSTLVKGI